MRRAPHGWLARWLQRAAATGRDAASAALNKLTELPPSADEAKDTAEAQADKSQKASWRINMLHGAAERLRGAADSYIAAKLDEIEARVDAKLDHLEGRLDAKMVALNRQLREMRDRELRHRLRLLRITLVFTVVVAALSLGYKWLAKYWLS
jgi:hypothetical protein